MLRSKNSYYSYVTIVLTSFLFYLFIQIELVLQFYWFQEISFLARSKELINLLFSQNENLLVALLTAGGFYFCKNSLKMRWVYWGLLVVSLGYLVLSHLFYSAVFDYFQFGLYQKHAINLPRFQDSLLQVLGLPFYLNLTFWFGSSILLYRQLIPQQTVAMKPPWVQEILARKLFYIVILLVFMFFGFMNANPQRNFVHHPLVSLISSVHHINLFQSEDVAMAFDPDLDLNTLRFGQTRLQPETTLTDYLAKRNIDHPNVIYIILESVGSVNLLPENDLPDAKVTPNLHTWLPHTILFPYIYNTFPGSERSHLPISTGGTTYTWGGRFETEGYHYHGPTLVNEMKSNGYQTGLFAAMFMDTENFLQIYPNLPFDSVLIPDNETVAYQNEHRLNSWGLNETEVLRRLTRWLDNVSSDKPFFAMFLTSNTHHPYSIPATYPAPFQGDDDLTRYHNALYFTDDLIGQLVAYLQAQQQLTQTLIVISGDHGEAFGDRHLANYLHKNHLYEENIRNFVLVLDFNETAGPITSVKRGTVGDIMPTILTLVGQVSPPVQGQNLFAANYQPRIHYFHKNIPPEEWGLLDGSWKFIIEKNGNKNPQLYDLSQDPLEQRNLIDSYADRVGRYQQLIANWYLRMNDSFSRQLADYEDYLTTAPTIGQITTVGPHTLLFGLKSIGQPFEPLTVIQPQDHVVAWTRGVPYSEDKSLLYEWVSPSNGIYTQVFTYQQNWSVAWVEFPQVAHLEEGQWQLRILDEGQEILHGSFVVSTTVNHE